MHEDWKKTLTSLVFKRKTAQPSNKPTDRPTDRAKTIYIIGLNLLTKINAPSLGSHVFQANTNLLTKFIEDWTINAASRVSTMQMLTLYNTRRTKGDHKSSP
ncbi:hypothetical protein DPMN_062748 [Dreissena polymorpha]|uniref:Uncharacterized protein n=1 Tax=Dreissena polymorpha TaxID=45954 RepID=A0A9D4CAE7_DREPO|nr:hypothetical protein DPMN_062748 [Dreissena polymorpha]